MDNVFELEGVVLIKLVTGRFEKGIVKEITKSGSYRVNGNLYNKDGWIKGCGRAWNKERIVKFDQEVWDKEVLIRKRSFVKNINWNDVTDKTIELVYTQVE